MTSQSSPDIVALADEIEDSYSGNFVQDILLDEKDRKLIVAALRARSSAEIVEPAAWLETYREEGGGKDTKVWLIEPKADPSTISIEPLYPRALAQGWRDISTAPKDGTEVLVWCDEGIDIARYSERKEDAPDDMGHDAGWWGVCQPMDPGRSMGAPAYTREAENQPWAWMPQPEPPYDDEGEPLFPKASMISSTVRDGLSDYTNEEIMREYGRRVQATPTAEIGTVSSPDRGGK